MGSLNGLCTEIAGKLSLSWSDLLSLSRWELAAGFAETSIAAAANTGAGAGLGAGAPTPQTDQIRVLCTYTPSIYTGPLDIC